MTFLEWFLKSTSRHWGMKQQNLRDAQCCVNTEQAPFPFTLVEVWRSSSLRPCSHNLLFKIPRPKGKFWPTGDCSNKWWFVASFLISFSPCKSVVMHIWVCKLLWQENTLSSNISCAVEFGFSPKRQKSSRKKARILFNPLYFWICIECS